ncbi:MAG TPA: isocitrate/isopropylmalate family dehydrogenase [Methanothrix sp.]|jgi:isocitrate dehydrogenase (NAD+)|uniref:isocitrate/isopropylmalate dehydrogenase family protein n=1 Tax=Methanothrix sp. TaxID=90426 RepID=UPI002B9D7314|nr:isocitrate/isopropylmalate family dehydrogenase [Methanothrix sp.]MDI9416194.1 isocitrate/isopropylmalate family dehydrogenase [Euryarchaeota archaeon]HON36577.1 isocitrate/isopropylmalate family dehydrogenase [Methanothrix sp.]HRU76335.1 isocitrate/isopropylmalate family dehydrogenase [Methanothrix sp.]
MNHTGAIERAKEHFAALLNEQLKRIDQMKAEEEWADYSRIMPIIIGVAGGDGIGPFITKEAVRVLEQILAEEIRSGKVELRWISGLSIEERAQAMKALPEESLAALKQCHVILKGPLTTPKKGDKWPNLESANVSMRRELDLFANVRPVKVPEKGIDWIFYRENTEGEYVLGSLGLNVTDDLAVDFKVITSQGAERIVRLAFEYARKNGINRVSAVTKANVIKTTDGKFLDIARRVAGEYPDVQFDDWFVDIMAAKLVDEKRRREFRVIVLPNLYGDILTDEAAEFQGGVGTAGSANIGKRYAMFEAIHGSAPRMVDEGRAQYADPASMMRACVMMLRHIGLSQQANRMEMALDICGQFEKRIRITGRPDGATGAQFTDYVLETISNPDLLDRWQSYQPSGEAKL